MDEDPTLNTSSHPHPSEGGGARPEASESAPRMAPDTLIFRILVALILLSTVGWLGSRTLWRFVKVKRAQKQAAYADQCIAENRPEEAQRAIRTAIMMAPGDPKVLRSTATWCSLNGRPEGFMYWDHLAESQPLTREDRIKKLDLALALHRLDISRELLKGLLREGEKDREILARAVQHHVQTGRSDNAIKAARIAVANAPNDPQMQLMLGSLLMDSTDRTTQAEAHRLLWNVALDHSKWHESAVDLLVDSRRLSDGDRLLLIRSIEGRATPTLIDRLRVLELRRGLVNHAEKLEDQAAGLASQYPGITNQVRIARWLADAGYTNQALSLIPRQTAGTNSIVAAAAVDLMIQLGDWSGLREILEQKPPAITAATAAAARGVLAAQFGRDTEVAGHFSDARQKAEGRIQDLMQVATYAERAGQRVAAAENLIAAAELNPLLTVRLCRRAFAVVQPIDDLPMSRRILDQLARFLPGEPSVLLERAWLDLLFEENVERARQSLLELKDHPKLGADVRVVLAFAELKRGDAGAAMAALETVGAEPATLSPRFQVAYSAVLLANGQREPARRLALSIPTRGLKKLELNLIAPLL